MAKRVALICKGKAKGFEAGQGFADLDAIDNNAIRVEDVLSTYGEWEVERHTLQDRVGLEGVFRSIIDNNEDLESFLFYYTGHGNDVVGENYYIVGEDPKVDIETALTEMNRTNLSISIVIDACHSERLALQWNDENRYELLTSSDQRFAYELENEGISYFSKQFCDAIRHHISDGKVFLEQIQTYLEDDYENIPTNRKQRSNHKKPIRRANGIPQLNVMAHQKIYIELKKRLKDHYQDLHETDDAQLSAFRKDILRYYPNGIGNFKTIKKAQSIDGLFTILVKDEGDGYLYCVLKSIDMGHQALETLKTCECQEVLKTTESIVVIATIEKNEGACTAEFFKRYTDDTVEFYSDIKSTPWEKFYPEQLKDVVQMILEDGHDERVELQLIVPHEKLPDIRFTDSMIRPLVDSDLEMKWNRFFYTTYKLQERLQDFASEKNPPINNWKKMIGRYSDAQQQKIGDRCYSGDMANLSQNDAEISLSEKGLTKQDCSEAYYFGVPFLLTPEQKGERCKVLAHNPKDDDIEATLDTWEKPWMHYYRVWKEERLGNIKEASFRFMGEMPPLRFICDDGYDAIFLSTIDNQ